MRPIALIIAIVSLAVFVVVALLAGCSSPAAATAPAPALPLAFAAPAPAALRDRATPEGAARVPDANGAATAPLDAAGRALLDPVRLDALRPAALVAELALRPTDRVADLGAGPGFLTLPLARAVPRGRVIATDVRADYLAVTRARAAAAGLGNVVTQLAPPDRPGLADGSIDLALLCQLDRGLADRAAYFAAVARTLRPGGRIALVDYARHGAADEEAARAAGLRVIHRWTPSPPLFLLVLAP